MCFLTSFISRTRESFDSYQNHIDNFYFSFYVSSRKTWKKPNHQKLCFFLIEIFIFKVVTMKTKLMWVETKLKNLNSPVIEVLVMSGKREQKYCSFSRWWGRAKVNDYYRCCRIQPFVSVDVSSRLKQTVNVLCPACQTEVLTKEFILSKYGRIRAVLKTESGLVVLKCEEFNSFPIFLRNMFSNVQNRALRGSGRT